MFDMVSMCFSGKGVGMLGAAGSSRLRPPLGLPLMGKNVALVSEGHSELLPYWRGASILLGSACVRCKVGRQGQR